MSDKTHEAEVIGIYKKVRLIGTGGMSEVYEVENTRLGSFYALKLFTCQKNGEETLRRFLLEGKLLAKLNHPRVVRLLDLGKDESRGQPYFVMDLVRDSSGKVKSLADVQPGTVDEETVGRWYEDLRDALAYIHSNGVVHRDLKLQNILIGSDEHAVLTDFGISKIFETNDGSTIVDTVQTILKIREGRSLVMGSIGYMAPELEMGVAASVQSDWYALGVIIYRLLTGSWCDSRTDVVASLEGYDPVWSRILPKLLHSNPNARECLSYAEEKKRDAEKAEFEAEERFLKEKARGHRTRHLFRYAAALAVMIAGFGIWRVVSLHATVTGLEKKLSIPTFETVFAIPDAAAEEETEGMPSREQFRAAMVDALVLTQGIFADLREELISTDKAKSEIVGLWRQAKNDNNDLYLGLPDSYSSSGENAALAILLQDAVKRLK